jgi:hypothetical protein
VGFIVVGALLVLLAPVAWRLRNRPGAREGAGAARTAVTGFGGGRPISERRMRVHLLLAPLLGAALIVWGVAHL